MNIFKNLHLKLLAVISAVILWMFVVGVENYVYVFPGNLPVKIINMGKNVSVASEIEGVKILYKTPSGSITANSNDFDLFLDAEGLGEGEYTLPVGFTTKNVKLAIVAVEPAKLKLKLEAITSRYITLESEITGAPAKDYEIKSLKIDTETVNISGAASAISELQNLPIKITLDGTETADFSRKITLEAPAEWSLSGKTVSFDPPVIQADIEIRKKNNTTDTNASGTDSGTVVDGTDTPVESGKERKTLMVEAKTADDLSSSVKELLPKNILVTVEGIPEVLATLDSNSLKLLIKTSSLQKGIYVVNSGDIVLPAGTDLKIISFSPEKVLVKF